MQRGPESARTVRPPGTTGEPDSTESGNDDTATSAEEATALLASCTELETIFRASTSVFQDGLGLDEGVVLSDEQAVALTAIVEGFEAVEVTDTEVRASVGAVILISELLLDRAGEPITAAESGAFAKSVGQLVARCEATRG